MSLARTCRSSAGRGVDAARRAAPDRGGSSSGPRPASTGARPLETRTAATSAPARARWRAATNPSPPLLPGPAQDQDRALAPPLRRLGDRLDRRRDRRARVLHQPLARARPASAPAGRRRSSPRTRSAGAPPPPPSAGAGRAGRARTARVVGGQPGVVGRVVRVGRFGHGRLGPPTSLIGRPPFPALGPSQSSPLERDPEAERDKHDAGQALEPAPDVGPGQGCLRPGRPCGRTRSSRSAR